MNMTITEQVRCRVWHSLSPSTAGVADCSLGNLQQFLVYQYVMSDAQIAALATHFSIKQREAA